MTYYCRVNGKEDIEQPTDWDHVIALDQDSQEKLIQANERTNNFSIIGIVLIGLVILYKSYRRKQSL
ncbi:LPXTG cell wall anchor domain-containing protein [Vagococcus xieshaowenii]|uniref:LPXTG cell wall anchor domain-containing protein n=1 Tax=Vagococcus xieshaowenii TaxID=2562451 RepID=A0AAJ5JLW9_9ENTE|nr:LPXTG cell wall anchor domain-containing protein [Vagococcus xieshaowenii]